MNENKEEVKVEESNKTEIKEVEENNNKCGEKCCHCCDKGKQPNTKLLISLIVVIFVSVSVVLYYLRTKSLDSSENEISNSNMEQTTKDENNYKHICLNQDVKKDTVIFKNMLQECTSDGELSEIDSIISSINFKDKYENLEEYYITEDREANYIIKPEDIYWKLENKNELELSSQLGNNYKVFISENKEVLITNLSTNTTSKLFELEPIKYIVLLSYCCDAEYKLILITDINEVYITSKEISSILKGNDEDIEKIKFDKLKLNDITTIISNYSSNGANEIDVYAMDSQGNKYHID